MIFFLIVQILFHLHYRIRPEDSLLCHLIISNYLLPFGGGGQNTFENTFFYANGSRLVRETLQNLLLILPESRTGQFFLLPPNFVVHTKPQTASKSFTRLWRITLFSVFVCACALVCVVFSNCTIHKFCNFS